MPIARFQMPDGRVARFEVPEGATPEQAQEMIARHVSGENAAAPAQEPAQRSAPALSTTSKIIEGAMDPFHGAAQALTHALPGGVVQAGNKFNNWLADKTGLVVRLPEGGIDEALKRREAAYSRASGGDGGIDWARLGGNVVSPMNAVMSLRALAAATLAGRAAVGAGLGAASSMTAPVTGGDYGEEKLKQAAAGAVGGAALPMLAAGIGRVISPKASTDAGLQLLRSEGIRPTVGQTLGGMANRLEEKAMSLPIMGDAIRASRNRATADLNTAVANRALAPIGQTMPAGMVGREAVSHVKSALGSAYDDLLPKMTVKADDEFVSGISSLQAMVSQGSIDPKSATAFQRILDGDVLGKFRGQDALTGQTLKDIQSDLTQQVRRFGASTDADQRLVGQALKEVQSLMRGLVARNNPQFADELKAIDTGWANFKRLEKAAGSLGADEGMFSAAQLQSAVKAGDWSKDKGRFSSGAALMQDLSDPAKMRLGGKVPDSGTAGRLFLGGGALASAALNPAIPASLVGGAAMYSPPAQALLRGLLSSRPEAAKKIAGMMNQSSPMLAPAGGLLGLEFLNQ